LIDILTEGYAAVNRRIWLLILPLALNLSIVFGPQVSFAPLFSGLAGLIERLQPSGADPALTAQNVATIEALGQVDMRQALALLNLVPTLPITRPAEPGSTILVTSLGGAALAFLLINAAALPLSGLFLALTATAVRGERPEAGVMARSAGRVALALLAFAGVVGGVGLALGLPFAFLSGLLTMLSPVVGALAQAVMFFVGFWVWVYIGFAAEAIAFGEQGPLKAIQTSFNLVRQNFWSTIGFLALSALLIPLGLGLVWQAIGGSMAGLVAAAAGSAYIGCGIAAARMVFFRERLRRRQSAPAVARPGR
jgi:hypothetical protein